MSLQQLWAGEQRHKRMRRFGGEFGALRGLVTSSPVIQVNPEKQNAAL